MSDRIGFGVDEAGLNPFPFVQTPEWVFLSGVSPQAQALYVQLSVHLNSVRGDRYVWPSRRSLARRLKFSRPQSVDRYLKELVEIGAIVVKTGQRRDDGGQDTNVYLLREIPLDGYAGPRNLNEWQGRQADLEDEPSEVDVEDDEEDPLCAGAHTPLCAPAHTPLCAGAHSNQTNKNQTNKNQKNPPPAVGELQVPTGARAAADAAESKDSRSRRTKPKQRDAAPPAAAVRLYRKLPERLRGHVPEHGSRRVQHALAAELEHRTAAELAERIARRSEAWAYRTEDVKDATAVAITIVQRGYDCVDVRCEDRVRLDTGQPCGHCAASIPAAAVTEAKTTGTDDRYAITGHAGTARPPWCGHCSEHTRQREDDEGRPYRCPTCHPLEAAQTSA